MSATRRISKPRHREERQQRGVIFVIHEQGGKEAPHVKGHCGPLVHERTLIRTVNAIIGFCAMANHARLPC